MKRKVTIILSVLSLVISLSLALVSCLRNSYALLYNVEALSRSEGGSFGPMCSKTGAYGSYYMKSCRNCDGPYGYYAMDEVAFCNN